jgi:hypothetical protein
LGWGVFHHCSPVYFVEAHRIASNLQIEGIIGVRTRRASNCINVIQMTPTDYVYMKFALWITIFAVSGRPRQQRSPQATTISSLLPSWPIQIGQPCLAGASPPSVDGI